MYSLLIIALALSVAGTLSSPTKVCAPAQWKASLVGSIGQLAGGKIAYVSSRGFTAIDYMSQKEAVVQNLTYEGQPMAIRQVTDFKEMKSYEIDLMKRTCTERSLPSTAKLTRYCEGDAGLKVVGRLTIGGKQAFTYAADTTLGNSTVYVTVFKDSFTPVSMVVQQIYNGIPQMIAYQLGNVSVKPLDQRIFELPSYCKSPSPAPAKRVCSPAQYETSTLGQVGEVVQGKPMTFSLRLKFYMDYTNKIEASITNVSTEQGVLTTKRVTKWNEKKTYTVNLNSKTCEVSPTPLPDMVRFCSDTKGSTLVDSFKIDGKMADIYEFKLANIDQVTTVYRETFEIISSTTHQTYENTSQLLALQYGNMTLGIGDRNVFNLPDYCQKDAIVG